MNVDVASPVKKSDTKGGQHLKKELRTPKSKLLGEKVGDKCKEVGDKLAGNPTTSIQCGRQMKRTGRQLKGNGRQIKEVGDKPAGNRTTSTEPGRQMKRSGRQASREPDHKHPAWETNEKKWETNERKWETSQPGTGPQAPSLGDK